MKLLFLFTLAPLLFADYTNCNFKDNNYEEVCKKAVKKGVSVDYVNRFLLSSKADKMDMKSFDLFHPKQINVHHANEKRANNNLVKYIPQIVEHLKEYKTVYDMAEAKYQVNREVVAAILMKETRLGVIKPKHDAFTVFNTLVLKTEVKTSRDKWLLNMGKTNMVSIISYCYEKGYEPLTCNFASSYAGAVGIPQFMPSNFIYIEGHQKEVGDLSVMEDAIISASQFLNKVAGFKSFMEWKKIPDMSRVEAAWYEYDFTHDNSSFVYAKGKTKTYNCFACEKPELEYLRQHVKKIMKYNNSSNYAVGVLRLAYEAR
ncbi:MAG: lytic murein transglycosylase [Campylobacterota bacterium]|nr:lytic murein transglycosylase [Campylobacterota bacterium]